MDQQVWYFNAGSTPGLDVDNTEASLRGAASQWYWNQNNCGIADHSSLMIGYGGRLGVSWGHNGVSSRGFGDLAAIGCGGIACAQRYTNGDITIDEADIRFSNARSVDGNSIFVNGGAEYRYDVQSVAAHETGHTIGIVHDWTCEFCNVMWPQANTNDMSNRSLGLGDAIGNNQRYN